MGPYAGRPEAVHPRPVDSSTSTHAHRTGPSSPAYVSRALDKLLSRRLEPGRFTSTLAAELEDVGGVLTRAIRVLEAKGIYTAADVESIFEMTPDPERPLKYAEVYG